MVMVQGITPPKTVQKVAAAVAAVAETMVAKVPVVALDVAALMDVVVLMGAVALMGVAVLLDVKAARLLQDAVDVLVLLVALETRMQSLNQHLEILVQELLETLVLMEILVLAGLVAQVQWVNLSPY